MKTHKTYTLQEATLLLMKYCSYQERCHQEVEQKLREIHMIPTAQEHIIGRLIEEGFLNETRFSQHFARGKFHIKKWGRLRIVRELKLRNISDHNIRMALKEIPEKEYLDTFHSLSEKKWEQEKDTPPLKRKQRLISYLIYRGWEKQLVYEKLRELDK